MNPTPEIIPEHQRRRPSTIAEQATLNFHKDLQGLRDYNASVRKFIFLNSIFIIYSQNSWNRRIRDDRKSNFVYTEDLKECRWNNATFPVFHMVEVFLVC